jgi:hypothetical protein
MIPNAPENKAFPRAPRLDSLGRPMVSRGRPAESPEPSPYTYSCIAAPPDDRPHVVDTREIDPE